MLLQGWDLKREVTFIKLKQPSDRTLDRAVLIGTNKHQPAADSFLRSFRFVFVC